MDLYKVVFYQLETLIKAKSFTLPSESLRVGLSNL